MKICKCQFCGTITKVDWTKGPLPSCPNCQGVFDLEDIYDEEDEDFDEDEYDEEYDDDEEEYDDEEDYEDYDEDTQSIHKTIIDWARYNAVVLVALAVLIGGFVCLGWVLFDFNSYCSKADKLSQKRYNLANEETNATYAARPNNNSEGGVEVRLVDNILIENGEGVKYEITAGLVDAGAERSETEKNETESHETETIIDTVYFENLNVGLTYKVIGTLWVPDINDYVRDALGNIITAEKTFTAETTSGTLDIEFEVDTSKYTGKTIELVEHIITV